MRHLLLILILFFMCSCENSHTKYQISDREKAVNKQLVYSAKMLSTKYNIRPCATSVAMPNGNIQYLELEFDVTGPLSKNTIRKILLTSVHDFLDNINNDNTLCTYLKNGHLDITEVGIGLFFFDSKHYPINKPNISMASIKKGIIRYYRRDPDAVSIFDIEETEESYDEALRILKNECKPIDISPKG